MEWGKRLEAVVAKAWAEKTGHKIKSDARVRRHPKHRWMIAHVDRWLTDEDAIYEGKTTNRWASSEWGEEDTDQIPDDYRLQVAHYLAVTDKPRCYIAVLVGGSHFRRYVVDRDMELENALIEAEGAFWHDHVLAQFPPPIDASEASARYLLAKYPKVTLEELDPPEGFESLALRYLSLVEAVKLAETEKSELANRMRDLMGGAGAVTGPQYRATWRDVKAPARTDWKAVIAEAKVPAAVIEKHTTRAEAARRFLVEDRKDVG
jgi:predicted phage-related endonuclease